MTNQNKKYADYLKAAASKGVVNRAELSLWLEVTKARRLNPSYTIMDYMAQQFLA